MEKFNLISPNAKIAENVKIGNFCIIEDGVEIGEGTVIMNYVELRKNTKIGKNCYIDSKVSSSGNVTVGDGVTLRYDTILARGCVVGDNTYICPRVMTNNLNTGKDQIGGANIGENCFIGTNTVFQHGVKIGNNVVTGAMSFVNKNIPSNEIWIGSPAKFFKENSEKI
ncbi:MAG: DapH/DapD/GlmU-related protein [Bacteroidia bacterium]